MMLAIWMVTYNHSLYIKKAIESIIMQNTDFAYKLYIGEDCSTDNTRELCELLQREYPEKIDLIAHEENIGPAKNARSIYEKVLNSGAKYIAMCEGDDYWVDPYKLQKQVDFLEANPIYALCTTKYTIDNGMGIIIPAEWENLFVSNENYQINIENFLNPYVIKTVCIVFRSNFLNPNLFSKKYLSDLFIWADLLTKGKGVCLNFIGGVYRLHNTGLWSGLNEIGKAIENYGLAMEMEYSFGCKYNSLKNFRSQQAQQLYNLLKEKKKLSRIEKKLMFEIVAKKIISKLDKFFTSIF